MKYNINLNLMEMVGLASACSQAIDREHRNFVRILNNNGEAIRALELTREKILLALKEESEIVPDAGIRETYFPEEPHLL